LGALVVHVRANSTNLRFIGTVQAAAFQMQCGMGHIPIISRCNTDAVVFMHFSLAVLFDVMVLMVCRAFARLLLDPKPLVSSFLGG